MAVEADHIVWHINIPHTVHKCGNHFHTLKNIRVKMTGGPLGRARRMVFWHFIKFIQSHHINSFYHVYHGIHLLKKYA